MQGKDTLFITQIQVDHSTGNVTARIKTMAKKGRNWEVSSGCDELVMPTGQGQAPSQETTCSSGAKLKGQARRVNERKHIEVTLEGEFTDENRETVHHLIAGEMVAGEGLSFDLSSLKAIRTTCFVGAASAYVGNGRPPIKGFDSLKKLGSDVRGDRSGDLDEKRAMIAGQLAGRTTGRRERAGEVLDSLPFGTTGLMHKDDIIGLKRGKFVIADLDIKDLLWKFNDCSSSSQSSGSGGSD